MRVGPSEPDDSALNIADAQRLNGSLMRFFADQIGPV
jgi:hypothetical protein